MTRSCGCIRANQSGCPSWACPPLKMLTMGMRASEMDHGALEKGCLAWWIPLYSNGMYWGIRASWQWHFGQCYAGKPWYAVHSGVTLTHNNYLNIVAEYVYLSTEMIFPHGFGLFRQDNATCHKAKMDQGWFEKNEFEVLKWPPNFPVLNSIKASLGYVGKQEMDPVTSCQKPQQTFRGLVESLPWLIRAVLAAKGGPT